MKRTETDKVIAADIGRYKKNKIGANLALLGLVFNCLYIMVLYSVRVPLLEDNSFTKFCSLEIGISVILTLVMLLAAFLASEGVKGYNKKFCIVLIVLAVIQIIRIFGLPLYGFKNNLFYNDGTDIHDFNYFGYNPSNSVFGFTIMLVYLAGSAACFIASTVISFLIIQRLEKHNKALESGELDIDEYLKKLDAAEDAAAAQVAVQTPVQTDAKEVQ